MPSELVSEVLPQVQRALPGLAGVAAIGGTAAKSFVKVPEGHVGLRVSRERPRRKYARFIDGDRSIGKLYGVAHPGIHIVVPFTHGINIISTQDKTSPLPNSTIDTKKYRQHIVRSTVTWGVVREKDAAGNLIDYDMPYDELVYRAIYKTANMKELEDRVITVCADGLRKALLQVTDLRDVESEVLHRDLVAHCGTELLEYGTEVRGYNLGESPFSGADLIAQAIAGNSDHQAGVNGALAIPGSY